MKEDPQKKYVQIMEDRKAEAEQLEARHSSFAYFRLLVFILAAVMAWIASTFSYIFALVAGGACNTFLLLL